MPPAASPPSNAETPPAKEPPAAPFPSDRSGDADKIWAEYFEHNRPSLRAVGDLILKLNQEKRHAHVIGVIEAALINGQAQPWMYEVLALSMEIEKRPAEEIERVVMSFTDFGAADFESMSYAAAMLCSFQRHDAALRMYRQASRMAPERSEPYGLGLKLAKAKSPDDVQWTACGVLEYYWAQDHAVIHRQAENKAAEAERLLRNSRDQKRADELHAAIAGAQERDVVVRLEWSGDADLELSVEEPLGSVCSLELPFTPGGGVHAHDGFGPLIENCYEEYLCPKGVTGEYIVRVQVRNGNVVANRAAVTITQHRGTATETVKKDFLTIGKEASSLKFRLKNGRRTDERQVAFVPPLPLRGVVRKGGRKARPQNFGQAIAQFMEGAAANQITRVSGDDVVGQQQLQQAVGGVVAFQPIVQVIPEGVRADVLAIVSADRRYVRLSISPLFTSITDVFTFTITR